MELFADAGESFSLRIMVYIQIIVGFMLLIIGAEGLVRGASRLAAFMGVSPLIIGLTVVAFGTSSPELAVSLQSSLGGKADIAVGNVVGSNIFNVLFILGISALINPLIVSRQLIRLDVPIMVITALLTLIFALNGNISRIEGGILFSGGVVYTLFLVRMARKEKKRQHDEFDQKYAIRAPVSVLKWILNLSMVVLGLLLLIWGSRFLVKSAVVLAQSWGLDELIIGLTIVAVGTSLPEVATSIMASVKGERDIAVGNVVGSNIFNILAVLGISGLLSTSGLQITSAALRFDIPIMLAISIACLPIFFTGGIISRWEGALFFAYYVLYTLYLILQSTQHGIFNLYSNMVMGFVVPLTLLTLLVITVQAFRKRHGHRYTSGIP